MKYDWLWDEGAPKLLVEALKEYGTTEIPGKESNAKIIGWAKEAGVSGYSDDDIPWCGLFMAVIVKRTGREAVASPLWARNWAKWGVKSTKPMLGDILVFSRGSGGHVALYVGENAKHYFVLGGNQSNKVNIMLIEKVRLLAARRPVYKNMPPNVRSIILNIDGEISTNEG